MTRTKDAWKEGFVPERAKRAITALYSAFEWDKTPEGFDYWLAVTVRLAKMCKEADA